VWRRRLTDAEVEERIAQAHRPYHAALGRLLATTRERFGVAVLLDLHSMPSLGRGQARIVIGDRFGRAAGARFAARAEAAVIDGLRRIGIGLAGVALNAPYAGGHVLDRHGRPEQGVHAIQLELDRALYLDAALDRPGPGMAGIAGLVAGVIAALEDEALAGRAPLPIAAE
jgi:N-formylglutamate amidohydrolase